eukprot:scaffold12012_cov104-Isochrysis_galbana.AAC.1
MISITPGSMPTMHASRLRPPHPVRSRNSSIHGGVQPTRRQLVRGHPPGRARTPVAAGPRRH